MLKELIKLQTHDTEGKWRNDGLYHCDIRDILNGRNDKRTLEELTLLGIKTQRRIDQLVLDGGLVIVANDSGKRTFRDKLLGVRYMIGPNLLTLIEKAKAKRNNMVFVLTVVSLIIGMISVVVTLF